MPEKQMRIPANSDALFLNEFPTPIALLYNRMLTSDNPVVKAETAIDIFALWMSVLTLELLNQYLERDIQRLDPQTTQTLNKTLEEKLPRPSLGAIVEIFFHLLAAYREHPDWLGIHDLHQILWMPGGKSKVKNANQSFNALTKIRNDIAHGRKPFSDAQWLAKFEEIYALLVEILARFSFFRDYPLVYIINNQDSRLHILTIQGLEPSASERAAPAGADIQAGQFYIHSIHDDQYIELHPFFMPWPSVLFNARERKISPEQVHVALYESYTRKKVNYFAVTAGLPDLYIQEPALISEFTQLVEETLRKYRQDQIHVAELDWPVLRPAAWDITQIETRSSQEKYSPELYYQRTGIKHAFEDFLDSDKAAFVLLGNSGVGKTSFLLSIYDYFRDEADTLMLVVNAAKLDTSRPLVETLSEMFRQKIKIKNSQGVRELGNILNEIDALIKDTSKRVILALDAINENADSFELLRKIDYLINYYHYPWLKIVLTSRPQAWQSMKQRVDISITCYYRRPDTQALEVELKGFDMGSGDSDGWLRVSRFAQAELPEVYALYQKKYHLDKSYDELSPNVKILMRDPLALRLIAQTYGSEDANTAAKEFPTHLRTSELYKNYVESLIEQRKLESTDVKIFLERQLLPLMFVPGEYRNYIHSDTLLDVIDESNNKSLAEKIDLTDELSNGKPVNQGFQNLVDAAILRKQGTYNEYILDFNYERFYDYFGGVYLSRRLDEQADKKADLLALAAEVKNKPFLWGPVRQVLLAELEAAKETHQFSLVFELLHEDNQNIQDLLRSTLILFARDYSEPGEKLLQIIFQEGKKRRLPAYRTLAVRVAGEAGAASILERGGADRDAGVRFTTIQSSYRYWQQDPQGGYRLLEAWARQVRGRFYIPNTSIAEAALGLSILIITDNRNTSDPALRLPDYQNLEITRRLQAIWRVILADLLYISKHESQHFSWRPWMREFILSIVIRSILVILRTAAAVKGSREASPIHVLEKMFTLTPQQRSTILRLKEYWDQSADGLAGLETLLSDSFDPENPISVAVVVLLLQLRAKRSGNQDLDIIERIYQRYFDPAYPSMAPAQLVFNSSLLLRRTSDAPSAEAWEIYNRLQRQHLSVGGMYNMTAEIVHESSYLEMYSVLEHQRTRESRPRLLYETVTNSVAQYRRTKNLKPMPGKSESGEEATPSLPALLSQIETLAIVRNLPEQALEAAKPIVALVAEFQKEGYQAHPSDTELVEYLGRMLARIRVYYPEWIDNFLEDTQAPESLRHLVRSLNVEENLWGDYLNSRYGTFGVRTIFIPVVRQELWKIFELSTSARSVEEWLLASMKGIVNFVYGAEVFAVREPKNKP